MSLEAFSKGDYAQALEGFNELLVLYPGDPLYKYYAAVSLVRLERDTERAVMLLDEALRSTYAIREIPSDALFWLGRAQQLSGRYTDAVSSYDKFSETAGRKTARKLGVQKYIKESKENSCRRNKGIAGTEL
jgi:TolA-binding protein